MSVYLFYALTALYFITLAARITHLKKSEIFLCAGSVIINLSLLISLSAQTGSFPVFSLYESFLSTTFVMGMLGLFTLFGNRGHEKVRLWVWIQILLLLFILFFFPKEPFVPLYDNGYIFIILFHALRCIALGLMLYTAAWFIQFIIQREMDERTSFLSHQGRNYLVLSAVFFLSAEYVGIIWCQNGWGDFWMWSKNFFQSTIIVLYLMLAFHIPGKNRWSEDIRSLIGALSGYFMLTLILLRYLP
jgi:hypothetical protein